MMGIHTIVEVMELVRLMSQNQVLSLYEFLQFYQKFLRGF